METLLPENTHITTFSKIHILARRQRLLVSQKTFCMNKFRPMLVTHQKTYLHMKSSIYEICARNKTDESVNKWFPRPFLDAASRRQAEHRTKPCRRDIHCYVCYASQNVQTHQNVSVSVKMIKRPFRCFKSNKYFIRNLLAWYQLHSRILSTRNCDISFCLFLTSSVATILPHVKRFV